MSALIGEWHALLILIIAGYLPNEIWRAFGLVVGHRIDEGAEILIWVRAVATAVLAGVIIQVVLAPPGALQTIPASVRFGALGVGFVVFLLARRSVIAGVAAGEVVILLGGWLWPQAGF
jgi:hypothetical protein